MLRKVLLCSAVFGAVFAVMPSAHAEPVCVDAVVYRPISYNPAPVCYYDYPFGAPCVGPYVNNNGIYVVTEFCVPGPLAEVLP